MVYLDNSATTQVCRAAADKAYDMMVNEFGNPSSLHTLGFRAERAMTAARQSIARLLGARRVCTSLPAAPRRIISRCSAAWRRTRVTAGIS